MLDLFASLGVHSLDLTRTDMDGHKQGYRAAQSVEALGRWMPWLLRSAMQCRHNLMVRPKLGTAELIQLDDLCGAMLERVRSTAFLILATVLGIIRLAWRYGNAGRISPGGCARAAAPIRVLAQTGEHLLEKSRKARENGEGYA